MNMNSDNTPKLRFPGFTGEWKEQPLSSFLFEHKTKSDGKCEVHSVSVSKGVVNQVEYLGRSFAAKDTSKYNLAKPNDIIYTKSPTGDFPYGIVKMNKNPYNVIVSPLYAVYSPINKYIGYILDSFFESSVNTNNYLSSLIQKGAKNTINISNNTFISKSVFLPNDPAEQEKIASCLFELDNFIKAQSEKVDALKEKKKGLMQQLFPQPGETIPRLRFPGFEGEWGEGKLKDVSIKIVDGSHNPPQGISYSSNYLLSSQNIQDGYIVYSNVRYLTDEDYNKENKRTEIKVGDVLLTIVGTIGRACVIKGNEGNIVFQRSVAVIKPNKSIHSYFLMYNLQNLNKALNSQAAGGAQKGIYLKQLEGFSIPLPSLPEQKKIAECLSALDDVIASESAKLDSLKDHKKGLMQQLFPQPSK